MTKARYDPTERLGVAEVGQIVQRDLSWIFREQPAFDVGIDAHLEQVDENFPTGKLIGAQIKRREPCKATWRRIRLLRKARTP
jgi:hypothetical protein